MIALVFFGDRGLEFRRVHVVRRRVHVDEDRLRSAPADRLGGGDEGVRHGDHLVPGPDPKPEQGQPRGRPCRFPPRWRTASRRTRRTPFRTGRRTGRPRRRSCRAPAGSRPRSPRGSARTGLSGPGRGLSFFLLLGDFSQGLAGFPATIVPGGTSFVTTLPAPTIAFSPTVTPARTVVLEPTEAPFLMSVGMQTQSASV